MVEIFGEGEVRAVTDGKIARVAIVDAVNPIERGFLVGPLKRQFKIVQPVTNKSDLQGLVVATLHPRELIGAENIVFVDRGKEDGVEIGNRFIVTRRGDGYQPILASGPMDDRRFPREIDRRDRGRRSARSSGHRLRHLLDAGSARRRPRRSPSRLLAFP